MRSGSPRVPPFRLSLAISSSKLNGDGAAPARADYFVCLVPVVP